MIIGDFLKALGQVGDPRFRSVLWRGIGFSLLLLFALTVGLAGLADLLFPATLTLPWIGTVGWADTAFSLAVFGAMLVASVFLMVPVASAFTGLFLEEIADAVEARHYPHLPAAARIPLADTLRDSAGFFAALIGIQTVILVVYALSLAGSLGLALFAGWVPTALFWGLSGYLLGREYFQMVAMRRIGRQAANDLRRRYRGRIWLAGTLMAIPLSVPVLNLVIPVLGVATFTHQFHRLSAPGPSGAERRYRAPISPRT